MDRMWFVGAAALVVAGGFVVAGRVAEARQPALGLGVLAYILPAMALFCVGLAACVAAARRHLARRAPGGGARFLGGAVGAWLAMGLVFGLLDGEFENVLAGLVGVLLAPAIVLMAAFTGPLTNVLLALLAAGVGGIVGAVLGRAIAARRSALVL